MRGIVILGLAFFLLSLGHPFYLSVTDLKYNEKEKAVQGSVKLFVSDLEDALKRQQGKTVDLIHPKDTVQTKALLDAYLKKRLSFKINHKAYTYKLLGFEQEQEAVWMYIEVSGCPLPKTVEIENTLLYDYITGQSNIVHMEVKGERKSSKVDNPDRRLVLEF
jgi:uncharacterized protein DUF6702